MKVGEVGKERAPQMLQAPEGVVVQGISVDVFHEEEARPGPDGFIRMLPVVLEDRRRPLPGIAFSRPPPLWTVVKNGGDSRATCSGT